MLDTLIKTSDGDMRRAITYLQSAARLHCGGQGGGDAEKTAATPVTPASIVEIAGVVPQSVIVGLCDAIGLDAPPDFEGDAAMSTSPAKKASFEAVHAAVRHLAMQGYSATQLVSQIHDYIIEHPMLEAPRKAKCALALGEVDKALIDGGDEELQLLNLCLKMMKALS